MQLQLQLVWLESIILLLFYESNMRQLIISPIYNNRQSIGTVSKWFYVQQEYKRPCSEVGKEVVVGVSGRGKAFHFPSLARYTNKRRA